MLACEQTQGQSIFLHGRSVEKYTFDLIHYLRDTHPLPSFWKLPEWLKKFSKEILNSLHSENIISNYTRYHDVGKPYCRTVDDNGSIHFPEHEKVSKDIYYNLTSDITTSNLIGWDMVLHKENASQIDSRCRHDWSIADAVTLMVVSLAEVHSNAIAFDKTIETISFKIKWKQINKRGNQICKFFFGEQNK